jgi:hypothetical protein
MSHSTTTNNIIISMFPPSGGVESLYRSNFKNLTGQGIDFDIIEFSSIRDAADVGPVQLSFVPSIAFTTMNMTDTEIQMLVENGEITFIWSFDDPYWEDYLDDIEYSYRLKNSNIIFNYDDKPIYHTYYRSGIYYVKVAIVYEDHRIELVKKIELGTNQIGTIPASNTTYKTNTDVLFESFNTADKIYYYIETEDVLLTFPVTSFTLSNNQEIPIEVGKTIYYGYYSVSAGEFTSQDEEDPMATYNNIDVQIYYSPSSSAFTGWDVATIPVYTTDRQFITYIINNIYAKDDFTLAESVIPITTDNDSYTTYNLYYYGYSYNFETDSWYYLLSLGEDYRIIYYTIDRRSPQIEWHYQDDNTPIVSASITGVATTGGDFVDTFALTLTLKNSLGDTIPGSIYYTTNGTDPIDNLYVGSTVYISPIVISDNTTLNLRGVSTLLRDNGISQYRESDLTKIIFNKS